MIDEPVFSVTNPNTQESMKIWANGRIQGFPDDFTLVVNSIPLYGAVLVIDAIGDAIMAGK